MRRKGKLISIFMLTFLLLQSMLMINAKEEDGDNQYQVYSQAITPQQQGVYLQDMKQKKSMLMYCISNERIAPLSTEKNRSLIPYVAKSFNDDRGYQALLYVGYPHNQTNLQEEYGLDDGSAYKETQAALWTLQNAEGSIYTQYQKPFPSYYIALLNYASTHINEQYLGYTLKYYESVNQEIAYQHLITLQKQEDDNIEKQVQTEDKEPSSSLDSLFFYLFIAFAILAMVVVIVYCVYRSKKCRY
ncbi:MAG: hypothetical protein EOM50_04730 [Erysipelotrichia bacterium]|nr:hypothetical protein [Erysipelotrichia bacterium]